MRARTRRIVALSAVATAAAVLGSAPAHADPAVPEGTEGFLTCGSQSWEIATARGNGAFTPAMDLNGTTVFVPVEFGAQSGVVYDKATGEVLEEFSDDSVTTKGGGHVDPGKQLMSCTYRFTFEDALVYGEFSGEVTGFATGRG